MREWLDDPIPAWHDEKGDLQSAIPYRVVPDLCGLCGKRLIEIADLLRCVECQSVNIWCTEQKAKLAKMRMNAKSNELIGRAA